MATDKRKTVDEQMHGMKEAIRRQRLEEQLLRKATAKCPQSRHAALASGERCPECGFSKL